MTTTRSILQRISEIGIRVDLEGIPEAVEAQVKLERKNYRALDEYTNVGGLRLRYPSAFNKRDAHFNPRSGKHINAWLQSRDLEPLAKHNKMVLERALPLDLFQLIMEGKHIRNSIGALETLLRFATESGDGCIHPGWSEAITGRWYMKEPQVQTMNRVIRGHLIPREDHSLYVIDWSQQELRILAHVTQEPALLKVFAEKGDPHILTFERVTHKTIDPDQGERRIKQRDIGKMLNYALIYGLDADGLGSRLKIPTEGAHLLLKAYFEAFPVLNAWRDEQKARVRREGGVRTLGGKFIPLEVEEGRRGAEESLDRKAVNYYVQNSAAEQLEILLHRIADRGSRHDMLRFVRATIHDALLLELPSTGNNTPIMLEWFKKLMELPMLGLPSTPAEIKGPAANWLEAMTWAEPEVSEY